MTTGPTFGIGRHLMEPSLKATDKEVDVRRGRHDVETSAADPLAFLP